MASYKLNLASIRGCPAPKKLAEALEAFGLPESEEFGVLSHSVTEAAVFATIIRKSQQVVHKVDHESKEVTASAVEKATTYLFGIKPGVEMLELYSGSAAAVEQVGLFLTGCLGLAVVVEALELDVVAAVEKLAKEQQKFQLRAVRVSDYSASSYMIGPYAPKFIDSEHGKDFMDEYAEALTSAAVKFQGPTGKVNVTMTPGASFTYSCKEDDQAQVQAILRKLL
jgi:hypothetical protein